MSRKAATWSGYGQGVRIRYSRGITTINGHVDRAFVAENQKVYIGPVIAGVDNRGQSTGPNLHFQIEGDDGGPSTPPPSINSARHRRSATHPSKMKTLASLEP